MDEEIRAADADRERVVAALREEMSVGRLTLEEFEERLSRAYAAKTWAQLRELTSDLPVDIAFDGEKRRPAPQPAGGPPPEAVGDRHPMHRIPWFAPFLLIPLIGLTLAVVHGAFGAVIPIVVIAWIVFGSGMRRARRAQYYRNYRMPEHMRLRR